MGKRVLLLDDEPAMTTTLTRVLRPHGIELDGCQEVDAFLRAASTGQYSAFVIDWCLRTCEGTDVCAQMRRDGEERPIALTSGKLDADHARLIAEAAGADCYIEKPATIEKIADEIKGLCRAAEKRATPRRRTFRCAVRSEAGAIVTIELRVDRLILTNHIVHLRPKELELLDVLLQRAGQIVSRNDLVRLVWGSRVTSAKVVETAMSRLRAVLGSVASIIETVDGGYTISVEDEDLG